MNNVCEIHNRQKNQVLQEEKLVLYCPDCANLNILSIIQFEEQLEQQKKQSDMDKINKNKKKLYKRLILGSIIALYSQLLPWIFAPFFNVKNPEDPFLTTVNKGYRWMWTQGWIILGSLFFIILGVANIIDAIKKINKLPSGMIYLKESKKDIEYAVSRFQDSSRLQHASDFMKKLRKKYVEQKTTVTPLEVMTEYELSIYYAKLIQYKGYTNLKFLVPLDSYGISLIAEKDGVKTAFMVVKSANRLTSQTISRLAVGRAYFDCEFAAVLMHLEFLEEIENIAKEFLINCWNMKEIEQQLISNKVEDWGQYLEDFIVNTDVDLKKYAIYEKERLIHMEELNWK